MSPPEVRVLQGLLWETVADAVVRPVRSNGEAVTSVGRRLEVAAGSTLVERVEALGELPVGGAVITPAGALPAGFVIHAVVQSAEEPVSAAGVERALVNVLRRARDWDLDTLALPPLGTGAGNLEPEEAARILADVLRGDEEGASGIELTVVVENGYEEEVFRRAVGSLARPVAEG